MGNTKVNIQFTKMSGAGNDFIMLDNRNEHLQLPWQEVARQLCDRHFGIGADGFIVIEKSSIADFKMNYFNADGSYGGMCGNGGRCSAFFAIGDSEKTEIKFEALDYIYFAKKSVGKIALSMKNPKDIIINKIIQLGEYEIKINFVNTGSPHVVIDSDQLPDELQTKKSSEGIRELGNLIRHHEAFAPEGANVNFIHYMAENFITMRTYERGVEGETLACGTGAVASAIMTSELFKIHSPIQIYTQGGEILTVSFTKTVKAYTDIRLIGSAKIIFTGSLLYDTKINQICSL